MRRARYQDVGWGGVAGRQRSPDDSARIGLDRFQDSFTLPKIFP